MAIAEIKWYNAMNDCWEGIQTAEDNGFNVDYEKKTYDKIMMTPNYNRESKKSVRKSIKESRQSILDKRFYELVDEGYIYDEDEDGMNMSYGELVAVSDDLWETLEDELKYYDDFQEAYDVYMDIMDNTSDNAKMFMTGSDEYFYFDINEDEGTYSVDGEIPFILEKLFKKFQKETDFERV